MSKKNSVIIFSNQLVEMNKKIPFKEIIILTLSLLLAGIQLRAQTGEAKATV